MKVLKLSAFAALLVPTSLAFNLNSGRGQPQWSATIATRSLLKADSTVLLSSASSTKTTNVADTSVTASFASPTTNFSIPPSCLSPLVIALPILLTASPAEAAGGVVPSAFFAYGHYLALLAAMGLLVYERVTIQPNMSSDQEKSAAIADGLYLLTFIAVVATGAVRTTDYGKGADFYIHEPFFWVKMALVGVQGGIGAFPALTHLRRAKGVFGSESVEPLSEKLATRMHKVLNAEITGILSIPLMATLMARGVWYSQDFPWQAGAAFTGLALLGSSAFYAKQALTWVEDESTPKAESESS